jgi:hypothetical protein
MPDDRSPEGTEIKTDPATAKRVRTQKKFEESMDEKGLLEDDQSLRLEPEDIRHEEPPGTEQSAG